MLHQIKISMILKVAMTWGAGQGEVDTYLPRHKEVKLFFVELER